MSGRTIPDRIVAYWSPKRAATRARDRLVEEIYSQAFSSRRGFDGAGTGRRNEGWTAPIGSANSVNQSALGTLRSRARDLVRNDPHASKAVRVLTNNIIGAGIVAQLSTDGTGKNKDAEEKRLRQLWNWWTDSLACSSDGRSNFFGLQALIIRTIVESGECLVRRVRVATKDWKNRRVAPLELQVLEPDYLDTAKDGNIANGNFIVQGVEFNSRGKRVAYWLFEEHPGEYSRPTSYVSKRVDASEVLHIFEILRPGQVRGVSWFAPALVKLRDYSDFSDATLLRQKIAACFSAFIESTDESLDDLDLLGGETDVAGKKIDRIEPGMAQHLPAKKRVVFPNPPSAMSFNEVAPGQLRAVAAGLGVTYESLTGDYSQVNFSSARMGFLEFQRALDPWRWHMVIPHLCHPVFEWWTETSHVAGQFDGHPIAAFTPPRREMIDPTREVPAQISAIRGGLQSLPETLRESGKDAAEVLKEISETNKELDRLGIILDCDPRNSTQSGSIQNPYIAKGGADEKDTNA